MKKSDLYKLVEDAYLAHERAKDVIVNTIVHNKEAERGIVKTLTELSENYHKSRNKLVCLKEALYAASTAEEISFIREEKEFEGWGNPKANKLLLPDSRCCTHEEWRQNPKLRALMPNKKF